MGCLLPWSGVGPDVALGAVAGGFRAVARLRLGSHAGALISGLPPERWNAA